jgi:D-beta-D-heptose 7-phosphate kinase/D-beta-D-heptose 1-phosphate adenosyltransferase
MTFTTDLQVLLDTIKDKRVLVLGDLMLDEYIWGDVRRISPEAPVPVVAVRRRTCVPGGAGNAALNVTSLGGHAILAGVVGADGPGEKLLAALQRAGVALEGLLQDEQRATTTKTRIVAHQQHVVRIDEEQTAPLAGQLEDQLLTWLERQVRACDACLLADYAKGVVSVGLAQGFIGLARQAGKPVVVDPKGISYAKYRGATVVKPNVEEARLVFPQEAQRQSGLVDLAGALLDLLNEPGTPASASAGAKLASAVLLTRGAEGMTLFEPGVPPLHIPSAAREVFDVTGAGDTAAGTLALALAAGASLAAAAQLANHAAGIVVGKVGTAQATAAELRSAVNKAT